MALTPLTPTEKFCAKCAAIAAYCHILLSTAQRIVYYSVIRAAILYGLDGPGFHPQNLSVKNSSQISPGSTQPPEMGIGFIPGSKSAGSGVERP